MKKLNVFSKTRQTRNILWAEKKRFFTAKVVTPSKRCKSDYLSECWYQCPKHTGVVLFLQLFHCNNRTFHAVGKVSKVEWSYVSWLIDKIWCWNQMCLNPHSEYMIANIRGFHKTYYVHDDKIRGKLRHHEIPNKCKKSRFCWCTVLYHISAGTGAWTHHPCFFHINRCCFKLCIENLFTQNLARWYLLYGSYYCDTHRH